MIKVKVKTGLDKILPGRILKVSDGISSFYITITDKLSGHRNAMPSYLYNILYYDKHNKEVFPMATNVGPNTIWRYIKGDDKFMVPQEEANLIISGYRRYFESFYDNPENVYDAGITLKNLHYAEETSKVENEYEIKHYETLVYPFLNDVEDINIWDDLRQKDVVIEIIKDK